MQNNDSSSRVAFDEEQKYQPVAPQVNSSPRFTRLVMNMSGGLVKNETQAQYVLIGVVVFSVLIILFSMVQPSRTNVQEDTARVIEKMVEKDVQQSNFGQ